MIKKRDFGFSKSLFYIKNDIMFICMPYILALYVKSYRLVKQKSYKKE